MMYTPPIHIHTLHIDIYIHVTGYEKYKSVPMWMKSVPVTVCQSVSLQPVSLLPTTLKEYEEALPDLPRDKVLTIFREVETAKSGKLSVCREVRRQIICEEEEEQAGVRRHKLTCLSPIVEHVGGRDSALGTSHSGHSLTTLTTSSHVTDRSVRASHSFICQKPLQEYSALVWSSPFQHSF